MMELSREAILAMSPGRELDAYVAKFVMFPGHSHPLEEVKGWCGNYSTSIAAAWEVVEKISDNKFNVYVMRRSDGKHFTECKKVGSSADRLFTVFAEGPTAPEAICRCALLTTLEESK